MPRQILPDPRAIHYAGGFDVYCFDRSGEKLWEEKIANALLNDGEYDMLDCWFRNGSVPTAFYLGLLKTTQSAIPADTATLATLVTEELVAGGYLRQLLDRNSTDWPSLALDSGDYRCTSKSVIWTATGADWAAVRWLFMCSAASGTTGRAWSVAQLQQDRTVPVGGSLIASYWGKLS